MKVTLKEKEVKAAMIKVYSILMSHGVKNMDDVKLGINSDSILIEFKAEAELNTYFISMK